MCALHHCSLDCSMESVYLVLTGITIGTVFTAAGCLLGAYLAKRTYLTVTEPPEFLIDINKDAEDNSQGLPGEAGSYDWDQYDHYLKPPLDEEGGEPEA